MTVLSDTQKTQFWENGFLTVEDAITPVQLAAMRADFAGQQTFLSDPADEDIVHDVLVFNSNIAVQDEEIVFGSTTLDINTQFGPQSDIFNFD